MSTDHAFKQDLARQIIPASADGGIISQLSNNPFFTAVLPPPFASLVSGPLLIHALDNRDLALQVLVLRLRSHNGEYAMVPPSSAAECSSMWR